MCRYVHPDTGELVKGSSVLLRTTMRTHDDERHRRACYDAMRGIGEFVAEKFVDIVKGRNRMAKMLGFVDYYDYKVRLPGSLCRCTSGVIWPVWPVAMGDGFRRVDGLFDIIPIQRTSSDAPMPPHPAKRHRTELRRQPSGLTYQTFWCEPVARSERTRCTSVSAA